MRMCLGRKFLAVAARNLLPPHNPHSPLGASLLQLIAGHMGSMKIFGYYCSLRMHLAVFEYDAWYMIQAYGRLLFCR
jgi:hypothetical protein